MQEKLSTDDYRQVMIDELKDVVQHRMKALEKIQENKARVSRFYNKKVVPKSFLEGDRVWKLIMPIGSRDNRFKKWSPTWEWPFKVSLCAPGNAYFLQGIEGEEFGRTTNVKYLKKYHPTVWVGA